MRKKINICSVSGGKDSTALYLLMQEFHGNDFVPVFADTGHEHPVTVNYVKNLSYMAEGPSVIITKANFEDRLRRKGIKPTGNQFLDMMLWKGRAPSAKAQFCTEHLKLWPILFYLEKHFPKDKYEWIMHTGLRGAESKKRAAKQPFSWNSFFDCFSVLPMLYESEVSMFDLMESREVPPNPLYALGYERVGCFPCIFSRKEELRLMPEWAWDRLEWYESKLGRTWFSPNTIKWLKHQGQNICSIKQVKEWCKTSRGGFQYDAFKSQPVEDTPSCMTSFVVCE